MNRHLKLKINRNFTVGSSETIRKTPDSKNWENIYFQPFDFSKVKQFLPQHISSYSPDFLSWFIGFSEGDGSFIIDRKNKRLFFIITQADAAFLYRLRTKLGFGSISNDHQHPEIKRFIVTNRSHIKILIHIFNGNLLLKKTTQRFYNWVDYFNLLTDDNIQCLSRWNGIVLPNIDFSINREMIEIEQINYLQSYSVVWNTSWLTGFIEAEGGFAAEQRKMKKCYSMRFYLDQTNELEILIHVQHLINNKGNICIRHEKDDKIHYRFTTSNWECLELLIKYLTRHSLQTKKNINFVRWKKLYNFVTIINKEKQVNTFVYSTKREQKIQKLLSCFKKSKK